MKVVRYTFDVCVRNNTDKDIYSLAPIIEKAIASCEGVCGCETAWKSIPGFNSVDVNKVLRLQQENQKWIGEKS
jgi:hypothetical protein